MESRGRTGSIPEKWASVINVGGGGKEGAFIIAELGFVFSSSFQHGLQRNSHRLQNRFCPLLSSARLASEGTGKQLPSPRDLRR